MAKKFYEFQPNDEVAESGDLSNLTPASVDLVSWQDLTIQDGEESIEDKIGNDAAHLKTDGVASAFAEKAYAAGDFCTYDGKAYVCKSGYTSTAASPDPGNDATHWQLANLPTLFSSDNTSNNLDNIRKSASESTTAKSYIDTQVATKAGLSDLPYNWDGMEFVYNSDLDKYVATAADGTLNIVSAFTSEQTDCLVKLPIPSSGKVIDIIIQYDTSTVVPQFTYRPRNGSTMLPASNITWKNISGDTMATGTSKVYWVMIQLWPTSSAEGTTTFYGTQTIRELSAS